jgi:hypothetical protein
MSQSSGICKELPWCALLLAVSSHFALIYDWANAPFLKLQEYASGHAKLPYQGRVLMAWVMHALAGKVTHIAAHAPSGRLRDPYVLVQTLCVFLALPVAILATRGSIAKLTGNAAFARWAAFLVALMAYFDLVLDYGLNYTLPYDVPSLAFFCLGIYLVMTRRWWAFYPVFVVATLNRETYIFMAVFCAVWLWTEAEAWPLVDKARLILPHLLAQGVLWVAIKWWIRQQFLGNATEGATGFFNLAVKTNVHSMLNPGQWPLFASLFGFLWIPLFLGRRYIRNRGIARATAVIVPLWLMAMFLVGVVVEVRVFSELAAILALVGALEAWHLWFEPLRDLRAEAA